MLVPKEVRFVCAVKICILYAPDHTICRLSTSHQLLVLASPGRNTKTKWGIPLTANVKTPSLTLLAEPSSKSKGAQRSRKAVVFVASTDAEASELIYASFQLQLTTKVNGESEKKSISILTRKTVHGILKDGTRSIGPISSVFLAGASFRFDLQDRCKIRMNCVTLTKLFLPLYTIDFLQVYQLWQTLLLLPLV